MEMMDVLKKPCVYMGLLTQGQDHSGFHELLSLTLLPSCVDYRVYMSSCMVTVGISRSQGAHRGTSFFIPPLREFSGFPGTLANAIMTRIDIR